MCVSPSLGLGDSIWESHVLPPPNILDISEKEQVRYLKYQGPKPQQAALPSLVRGKELCWLPCDSFTTQGSPLRLGNRQE